jgi:hypothetical protein
MKINQIFNLGGRFVNSRVLFIVTMLWSIVSELGQSLTALIDKKKLHGNEDHIRPLSLND